MPLQYSKSRALIIAASSPNRLTVELKAYNVDPASPGLHVVYAPTDLPAVLALPVDTPWTIVGGTGPGGKDALTRRFGPSLTFPRAMAVYERDLAWAHGRVPAPGPEPTYNQPPEPVTVAPTFSWPPPPRPKGYVVVVKNGLITYVVTADNRVIASI